MGWDSGRHDDGGQVAGHGGLAGHQLGWMGCGLSQGGYHRLAGEGGRHGQHLLAGEGGGLLQWLLHVLGLHFL